MLKELSWYIETNRFTNIVGEIEEKAAAYSEALRTDAENREELRDDLRELCQWHMEKSGYRTESVSYINIDMEFFNGHEINRAALDTFEKEIIKAHMYQKHLWEFMGTTGSMTVISKSAMRRDGFAYESFLPLEYRKAHRAKSPLSGILKENPAAVPFYIYPDGTVSDEYNPEKSKYRLDALRDKSGFDWTRKGWDPNYEVQKDGWHGEYDETGIWTMVREGMGEYEKTGYAGARFEKFPEIEILKDGDSAILYDPDYSLISTFGRIFLLADGGIYGAEQENAEKTVSLIKDAMAETGIKSIKAVCGGKDRPDAKRLNAGVLMEEGGAEDASGRKPSNPVRKSRGQKITNERILLFYRKLFGETLQGNAEIAGWKEYRKIRKELVKKDENKRTGESGRALAEKISVVKSTGAGGEEIIRAVRTEKTKIPLSVFNPADKKETGLTDEEFSCLQNYAVPENKKELFSRVILNLLQDRKMIAGGGKEVREFFDTVYADVVQDKKSDEAVSVETTFSQLCSSPEKSPGCESVEAATIEKLLEAKRNLPEQKTEELQKKVDAAVENIIRNFSAVRMSTGMTPEEAVKLAARTVGGKDSGVFVPPVSGIVYQTPAKDALTRAQKGSGIRIFSDIKAADLIERAKSLPSKTKEVSLERLVAESRENNAEKAAEPFPNLFSKEEREKWYKTEGFSKTGLSVSDAESLIQLEEELIRGKISSSAENIETFSKTGELDRKMGYTAESTERSKNALIARIMPVTRSLSAETVVKRLEEIGNTRAASLKENGGLSKELNGVARNLKNAEINADGRLSRELAAAISMADFADSARHTEKEQIFHAACDSKRESYISVQTGKSTVYEKKLETGGKENYPAVSAIIENKSAYSLSSVRENFNDTAKNEPLLSSVHRGNGSNMDRAPVQDSSESQGSTMALASPMPALEQKEETRLERMNANYEHDKAVLAKADPLFARNEFWDVGHAGGSGEDGYFDKQQLNKIKDMALEFEIRKTGDLIQ